MYSILSLAVRLGWAWDKPEHYYPYMMDAKGVEEAIKSFPLAVRSSYKRVGIVIDADTNLKERWDQSGHCYLHWDLSCLKILIRLGLLLA